MRALLRRFGIGFTRQVRDAVFVRECGQDTLCVAAQSQSLPSLGPPHRHFEHLLARHYNTHGPSCDARGIRGGNGLGCDAEL